MSYYMHLMDKNGLALSKEAIVYRTAQGLPTERVFIEEDDDSVSKLVKHYLEHGSDNYEPPSAFDGSLRVCSECRVAKEREQFTKNKNRVDGLDAKCRDCKKMIARIRSLETKRSVAPAEGPGWNACC
jgi:hypothetical protein